MQEDSFKKELLWEGWYPPKKDEDRFQQKRWVMDTLGHTLCNSSSSDIIHEEDRVQSMSETIFLPVMTKHCSVLEINK